MNPSKLRPWPMKPSGNPAPRRNQSALATQKCSLGRRLYFSLSNGESHQAHNFDTPRQLGKLIPTGCGVSAWPEGSWPRSGGVHFEKRSLDRRTKSWSKCPRKSGGVAPLTSLAPQRGDQRGPTLRGKHGDGRGPSTCLRLHGRALDGFI